MATLAQRYGWKTYHFANHDANLIGEHMRGLGRNRELTPRLVVDDARDAASPTHEVFEWDDAVAAERHREATARSMLASLVTVTIRPDGAEEQPMPMYVNVVIGDTRQYVATAVAMQSVDLKEQILRDALREMESFKRKYERLKVLSRVMRAIDRTLEEQTPAPTAKPAARQAGATQAEADSIRECAVV